MTPENMFIGVLNSESSYNLVYDQTEPWFGTNYSVKGTFDVFDYMTFNFSLIKDIPKDWINDWREVKVYPDFHLPHPNQFLTNNFDLLPNTNNLPEYPTKILNTDIVELWYRKDQKFNLPIAYYYFHLITPSASKDYALK